MDWVNFILQLGAIATALTAVGRLLIGAYKKYITDPHDRRMEQVQKRNSEDIKNSISPLTHSIEKLNYLLEEGREDRKRLHEKDKSQDVKIENHEIRITVLEDWRNETRSRKD